MMGHNVLGLDLGSSEVKAVVVKMALRGSELVSFDSEPVALGEDGRSAFDAVLEAAARLVNGSRFQWRRFTAPYPAILRRLEKSAFR